MSRFEYIAGGTTGHLTNTAKDAGQVIGYSHSTWLSRGDSQVAGYGGATSRSATPPINSGQAAGYNHLMWLMALMLGVFVAGCSGGGGGSDPIVAAGSAPMVAAVAPLPNAIIVPINTKIITAAFTKAMDPATLTPASFTLACPAGTSVTGAVTYLAASNLAMLTLPAATNLSPNTLCIATVTTGVKDATGIPLANNFVWNFTTGATTDSTAPTVAGTTHANGATNVPINTQVGATFSEGMDPLTITATTFTFKQGATVVPGTVTYTGVSAVFTPASNLAASTTYTATITAGAKSAEGNALASDYVWSWTTGAVADTVAPTVTNTIHANGATNVPINTKVGATFSEGMDPLTINNVNFTLKEAVSGNPVAGIVSYSGVSALFIPLNTLAPGTRYNVTVKGGASGAKSLEGNPLANDFAWSWTTSAAPDTTAPMVTGTIHANGATNVATNTKVGAIFTEGMDPLTITNATFTLKETVTGAAVAGMVSYSGVSALFIPLNNLAPGTRYTVSVKGGVSGAKDLSGNPLASDFAISWTTAATIDTTSPTVTGTIHTSGQTNVAINTKIGATFSEGMDPLTITNTNFTLRETVSGTAVVSTVSYSGVSAILIPWGNLASNTGYTVTIKSGIGGARDLAGNPLASDFVNRWTTATTPDLTAPTVIGTIHANGANNVAINPYDGVMFSEGMDPLTITNANFTVKETLSGAAVAGTVSFSGVNAEFIVEIMNPSGVPHFFNFTPNTSYTATIKGGIGGAEDLAGNPLASDYIWSWTTGANSDSIAPTVIQVDPADFAKTVAVNSVIKATFSEPMEILDISTETFTVAGVTGTVTYDAINRIATFAPSNNFASNTTYTAKIASKCTDIAGNWLTADKVWSFTTAEIP